MTANVESELVGCVFECSLWSALQFPRDKEYSYNERASLRSRHISPAIESVGPDSRKNVPFRMLLYLTELLFSCELLEAKSVLVKHFLFGRPEN